MKKFLPVLIINFLLLTVMTNLSAQNKSVISNSVFKKSAILTDPVTKSPSVIRLSEGNYLPVETFIKEYRKTFNLSDDNELKLLRISNDKLGQTHRRYKQYYKGIEIAEVQFIIHEKEGMVFHANGRLIHNLNLDVKPALSENEALQHALNNIKAEKYMWEDKKTEAYIKKERNDPEATYFPQGNLVISAKNFEMTTENFRLAYRFNIYSEKPLERYLIDIDARTGEIINKISQIQTGDIPGQGMSFYNGNVSLTVADTAINNNGPGKWHLDTWNAYQDQSWWVSDPALGNEGGYSNGWYEGLDTDPVLLTGTNITLGFYHRYRVENPGGEPSGYNGWDGMNIRISTDGGNSWQVLQNPVPAYSNSSLYSFGEQHGEGTGVPGWTGELTTWTNVSFDLSSFAGQTVRIRFAFASDPAFATDDGAPNLFGWQIDNINISSSSGTLFSNNGEETGMTAINLFKDATFIEGNYRLRQYGRGGGIATYDAKNGISFPLSVDFVDSDTNFDSNNSAAGVSVHWALENAYDYFLNNHGRNSFDDNGAKMTAYVHFDNEWFNASWDGERLRFGDGVSNNNPLVSIDIVAHELAHGVTQYTAGLIYQNEWGALNESFSDIFGTAVEFTTLGTEANWFMGEQNVRLRSMLNPNMYGQPDTYLGFYWYVGTEDNGGVHYNSGVQNFWFYLLSEGGTGTNDNGHNYSVAGLGIDQAAQIAYRNLSSYLIPTSEYFDARYGSLIAAIDLFGDNSPQLQSVIDAWNAVGVVKPSLTASIETDADTINFLAEASATTDTIEVIIYNYGLQSLIISDIQITGATFQLAGNPELPDTLQYDESVAVKIAFIPVQDGEDSGVLSISSNDPAQPVKEIILKGTGYTIHSAFDKIMYASSGTQNNGNILSINKLTGEGTNIGPSAYNDIISLSINPVSKQLYGLRSDAIASEIHRIDAVSGTSYRYRIINLPEMSSIAFDTSGTLFGALPSGEIYSIDITNGSFELATTADIEILAMTFEPATNQLWATVRNIFGLPKDKIYKIDINTGDTTYVGKTGFNTTTNSLVFDENNTLYGVKGTGAQICDLFTVDVSSGTGNIIGSTGMKAVTGLAYAETGITDVATDESRILPEEFTLSQNYPNPFNPSTIILFQVAEQSHVSLKVYDILGKEIANLVNREMKPGNYQAEFDASALSSGIYFYRLQTDNFTDTKKMVLIR